MTMLRYGVALLVLGVAYGDVKKEEPVGLMLLPGGAKVLRAGTETPLAVKAGDVLFAGDSVRTEAGAASFLYCPQKQQQGLAASSEVLLDSKALKIKTGKLGEAKAVASCFLPPVVRVAIASQQHYGVSMTRGLGQPDEVKPAAEDQLPPAVKAELAPHSGGDQPALIARAAVFEKNSLSANALAEYRKLAGLFPDAVWVKGKIFELSESLANEAAAAKAKPPEGSQTFALLIGVSKYQKLPQDLWLQFANKDATVFEQHVRSPRGGSLPAENVITLTDEKATTAALRNAFQTFLKGRATKKDTVLILIAGHGTVESPGSKGAYILTHDSDPQDLQGTALPMAEIQTLVQEELSKVGRVAVFVDVCRAGAIGTIKSTAVNGVVEKLGESEGGEILGIMASRPRELSHEGPQFGGGHGAFSYFLLKALNGAADKDGNGIVDVNEVISYVQREVPAATNDKQHPREFGTMDNAVPLSNVKQPGIAITENLDRPFVWIGTKDEPAYLAAGQAGPGSLAQPVQAALNRYQQAIDDKRLAPGQPGSAFAALNELRGKVSDERFRSEENKLRIALENEGQQVVLKYLTGDQVPQTKSDFSGGEDVYKAARRLTPESLFLDGREAFMKGRAMLFEKRYREAAELLEYAVNMDPTGAHAFNALGIAYLEQADYGRAIPAFRDAIKRAPHWAYPLHNLALAQAEAGDYQAAIRSYQNAMRIQPKYSYLPYNLGLVYQRINRRKDAERSYLQASAIEPTSAEPFNALGSLKAATGKTKDAEAMYRKALELNPKLLPARHNLGLLLTGTKDRKPEGIALFRENLAQDRTFVASRIALAEVLTDPKDQAAEYREVLKDRPDYLAARVALAQALNRAGDRQGAERELDEVRKADPKIKVELK